MNRMEKLKAEKEGLSILPAIYHYSKGTIAEIPESELFLMRWYGFFYRKKQGNFMLRIRVPSGKLTTEQADLVADLANRFGDNTVAITTRMGIQIRNLPLRSLPFIWEQLQAINLDSRQTGFDNVRNFMNCPVAGLQKDEAFDASDIIDKLTEKIIGNPLYANLPRKFNISVTGCHEDCGHSRISDIGLVPQVVMINGQLKEGFRIRFGGAIGRFYAAVADDLGVWLPKQQAVDLVLAVLDIFIEYGTRENRTKARLLHLKEDWGLEQILVEVNKRVFPSLNKLKQPEQWKQHHDHIGIYRQKESDRYYIGLTVPTGKMTAFQFQQLAELARTYGRNEIRLTAQQNVIIPHVREEKLDDFKREKIVAEFPFDPTPLIRGLVACTGKEGCDLAIVATKTPSLKLITELEEKLIFTCDEFRLHWSGCPNSCAIVQTGDIGLHGTDLEINGKYVDAVNIYYGGHIGHDTKMGTLIREKVPVAVLTETLIEILTDEQYFKGIFLKK